MPPADVFADAEEYGRIQCPACDNNVFAILRAFREGEACPYCGLPADAARMVLEAARKGAEGQLRDAYAEAVRRGVEAERQRDELLERLRTIREAANRPDMSQQPETGGDALARAEQNFAAAKESCRTGHGDAEGTTCTYGGMSSANGYWLASEDCELGHGEVCDLRAVCDGAATETGFRGSEPDPETWYWIWRVAACQPCADLYVSAHPEWKRPDPDEPKPTHDEIMARLHEEVEASRAAMGPAEREASDMVTNLMLYGQHPVPSGATTKFTGFGGLLDDVVALTPPVKPARDRPADRRPTTFGYILPPDDSPAGEALWNEMLYGAPKPEPATGSTVTGLFDALGGVVPGARADPTEAAMNAIAADEVRAGRPVAGSKWAPVGCTCPWPWPMSDGRHILTICPHYAPPPKPVVGRSAYTECHRIDNTWVHAKPHLGCPTWTRGR